MNLSNKKYIFLDFDGVLHPESDITQPPFVHVFSLSKLLLKYRAHAQVNIVISSSWRQENNLDQLKSYFPSVIRDLIIGVTPIIKESMDQGGRQKEIEIYCNQHAIKPHELIAIDDLERLFEQTWPNLILCKSHLGLTFLEMKKIEAFLKS